MVAQVKGLTVTLWKDNKPHSLHGGCAVLTGEPKSQFLTLSIYDEDTKLVDILCDLQHALELSSLLESSVQRRQPIEVNRALGSGH